MLDLDVEGFADRLGAGLERLVRGELTLLVDMPDTTGADLDAETKRMLGRMVTTMCTVSECIALVVAQSLRRAAVRPVALAEDQALSVYSI